MTKTRIYKVTNHSAETVTASEMLQLNQSGIECEKAAVAAKVQHVAE